MRTEATELNLNETEEVTGGGLIVKFFNPYAIPGLKPQKTKAGNKNENG